jgi:hypothetical protein
MSFSLSGNAGVAGATISWSGTSSGSVVADSSGNYSAPGAMTSGGSYSITASLALYNFGPPGGYFVGNATNDRVFNFTATAIPQAQIVQKAVKINTTGGDSATATFAKALTAGNYLIVAVMAVDTGAAVGTDVQSGSAESYASISDTQGNHFEFTGQDPSLLGDRTNGTSLFTGIYIMNSGFGPLNAGADSITFTFTPLSSAGNCQVGLVAYEINPGMPASPSDTTSTPKDGVNGSNGAYPGLFPPALQGDITLTGSTYGMFFIVCAAATTSNGTSFSAGVENATDPYSEGPVGELGWSLDASQAAFINGVHTTMAVQTEFATGEGADNPCGFGVSGMAGIASAASAYGFDLFNVPYQGSSGGGGSDTYNPAIPYLGTVTVVASAPTSGPSNPFLGKVLVLASIPPAFQNTPCYLGHVVEGSAPASGPDNLLGQVVVVASPPARNTDGSGPSDPFLGTVDKE